MVGAMNRSMAAISGAWLRRKMHHAWLGDPPRLTMYLATVDWSDFKAELEQFAVDARCAPEHLPGNVKKVILKPKQFGFNAPTSADAGY
jgi:hypothetical protein